MDRLSSCFLIPGSVNIMLSIPGHSGGPRSGREPLFILSKDTLEVLASYFGFIFNRNVDVIVLTEGRDPQ